MSGEIEKLKAKLAKLLNMTVENGCTEDEQESAMRMAAGLAARAGIESELEKLKNTGQQPATRKATRKNFSQEFKIHQVLAAQAAAELYGCEIYAYDRGKSGIFFVGREENIESAETTMFWLMRQVELLYKQNLPRGLTQSARAEERSKRLALQEEQRRAAMTPAQREAEDKEAERQRKKWERQAARRKGPRARTLPTGNGTSAGFAAGDSVKLRKEVE